MSLELANSLISVAMVSLVSLIGVGVLALSTKEGDRFVSLFVGLAIGALVGDVAIHLWPESYEALGASAGLLFLAGFLGFFTLEKVLHWRHGHHPKERKGIAPVGILNLVADSLHNLIDGMLIGASFLTSFPLGLATTLAVVLHEIPQEIGDYAVLLHAGFRRKWAILFNLLSAVFAFLGVWIAFGLSGQIEQFSAQVIAFSAGGFLYIVAVLVRQFSQEMAVLKTLGQAAAIAFGVAAMWLLTFLE
jgi:zinc and cadmium transporter